MSRGSTARQNLLPSRVQEDRVLVLGYVRTGNIVQGRVCVNDSSIDEHIKRPEMLLERLIEPSAAERKCSKSFGDLLVACIGLTIPDWNVPDVELFHVVTAVWRVEHATSACSTESFDRK